MDAKALAALKFFSDMELSAIAMKIKGVDVDKILRDCKRNKTNFRAALIAVIIKGAK